MNTSRVELLLASFASQRRQLSGRGMNDIITDRAFINAFELFINILLPHEESSEEIVVFVGKDRSHQKQPPAHLHFGDLDSLHYFNLK